ncbi:M20 family metallo-hydrolase [Virgibacillus byunsanensis]|uniref:M20 family metallo-hydrolase n=1 Tax=Virgibacillus byunsanensis TaxID=570945 RepID=A0ABW3LPY6_9BACI
MNEDLKINLERLISTFDTSSSIGVTKNNGLNRIGLTSDDKKMRDIFVEWLKDEGLDIRIDDLGNIYGKRCGTSPDENPVVIGSHLDTQPNGGRFDGILGVLSSLEVIRVLNEKDIKTKRSIEIVNFTLEEGARFGIPMEGSGVITGNYEKEYVYKLNDKNNVTFKEALESIGYRGEIVNRLKNPGFFVELHIEQGPMLEINDKQIGIVEGVKGVTKFEVVIEGQASHAAYPAIGRRDALVASSEMVLFIDSITEQFDDLSTTVGVFEVSPSLYSMSAGRVKFTFDVRHINDQIRAKAIKLIINEIKKIANEKTLNYEVNEFWNIDGTYFSNKINNLIENSIVKRDYTYQYITSGAGHDAKFFNDLCDSTVIFTPSKDGLSHCEEEFTSFDDIEKAANVLLDITYDLANK